MASQYVDERIVEMRIDNDNFEKGARQTISTLEKLEQALHLKGDVSAMDELNESVSGFKADGMISGLEKIQSSFSALEIAGMRVISNLTDSVYNFATKTIKSFTVEPISQGFSKFGEKTTAVSTLTAQGYELEKVNQLMEDLNWFTDETSYNFTDMVGNIAKFTATGQDLDQSVTAMEGIALWAALSGQNATKASMAMYQLSQAMGKGALKYDDYKSIQNASMDTQEFRQQAAAAAVELGYLKETAEGVWETTEKTAKAGQAFDLAGLYSSEALSRTSWFSSDVMMNVFNKYSKAVGAVQEYMEATGIDTASRAMEEMRKKGEESAAVYGGTLDEAFQRLGWDLDEFSLKALEAGQNARTWADVVDSVKDAVSTGWMTTFEKFFGDADQATKFWTNLANQFYDIFAAGGERRNSILDLALNGGKAETTLTKSTSSLEAGWSKFEDRVESSGHTMEEFEQAVYKVADRATLDLIENFNGVEDALQKGGISLDLFKQAWYELTGTEEEAAETTEYVTSAAMGSLENMRDVAMQILRGDWGNGDERREALEALGYDFELLQAMAGNLNNNYGLSDEGLLDAMEIYYRHNNIAARTGYETFAEYMEACGAAAAAGTEAMGEAVNELDSLYNGIQNGVAAGEELTGVFDEGKTGGEYFREGIVNILETINTIKDTIDGVKESVFGDEETVANRLRSFLKVFWQITEGVKNFVQGENLLGGLETILGAIFGLLNGIGSAASLGFKFIRVGFSILKSGLDIILSLLSAIDQNGALQNFGAGLKNLFEALSVPLQLVFAYVNSLMKRIRSSERLETFVGKVSQKISVLTGQFSQLTGQFKQFMFSEQSKNAIIGFLNRAVTVVLNLGKNVSKLNLKETLGVIWTGLKNIFATINLSKFSLSETFETLYSVLEPLLTALGGKKEDLKTSIQGAFDAIEEAVQERWGSLKERLSKITFTDVLKGLRIGVATVMLARFSQLLGSFKKVVDEVKTIPEGLKNVLTSTTKVLDSVSGSIKANTIIKLAVALGILAGAMIALSFVPADKLTHVATVIGLMMVLLTSLAKGMSHINKLTGDRITGGNNITGTLNIFNGLAAKLVGFALAIAAVAASIVSFKKNQITWGDVGIVLGSIGILLAMYIGFSAAMKRIAKNDQSNAWGNAAMLLAMVVAVRMLVKPLKQLADIIQSDLDFTKAYVALAGLMGLMVAVIGILSLVEGSGKMTREGSTFKKLGGSGASLMKAAGAMLAIALAMTMIMVPLESIAKLMGDDPSVFWKAYAGLAAIIGLMTAMGLLLGNVGAKNNSGGNFLKFAAGMVIVALALDLMIPAFLTFAGAVTTIATAVPWENLTERMDALYKAIAPLGALVIVLAGLGVAMAFFGIGLAAVGVGVFSASAGFMLLSVALFALAKGVDIIVEAFPKFIEGLADAGRTIRERKGDLIAGILLFGALAAVLFLLSKSFKNIFGGRNFGEMFGNLATSMVGGIGNLFSKLGAGLVDQLPNIMKLMGLIAVMIGLYMLDIIPDLVEIGVKAFMIFFTSLAESINEHQNELVDSITSIIKSILSVVRGVIAGFWEEANPVEKLLVVAAGVALIGSKFLDLSTKIGGADGKGGAVGQLISFKDAIRKIIEAAGGLGPALTPVLAIGGTVALKEASINGEEKRAWSEVEDNLDGSVEGYVKTVQDLQKKLDIAWLQYNESAKWGPEGTYLYGEEIEGTKKALSNAYSMLAEALGISVAELEAQIAAADGDIEKIKALNRQAAENIDELGQVKAEVDSGVDAGTDAASTSVTESIEAVSSDLHSELARIREEFKAEFTAAGDEAGAGLVDTLFTNMTDEDAVAMFTAAGDEEALDIFNGLIDTSGIKMPEAANFAVDGFISTIRSRYGDLFNAGGSMYGMLDSGLRNRGRIASPSKEMEELGGFSVEGFVIGILGNTGDVHDAGGTMADELLNSISQSMAQVGLIAGEDFTISPIISPVMDYSGISGAANELNGMFRTSAMLAELGEIAASRVVNSQINYMAETQDILNQLHVMSEQINSLGVSMANMKVVLDSGALVGATSAQIDRQLGIRAVRKGRGN